MLGDGHKSTLSSMDNLANLRQEQGRPDEAAALLAEAQARARYPSSSAVLINGLDDFQNGVSRQDTDKSSSLETGTAGSSTLGSTTPIWRRPRGSFQFVDEAAGRGPAVWRSSWLSCDESARGSWHSCEDRSSWRFGENRRSREDRDSEPASARVSTRERRSSCEEWSSSEEAEPHLTEPPTLSTPMALLDSFTTTAPSTPSTD